MLITNWHARLAALTLNTMQGSQSTPGAKIMTKNQSASKAVARQATPCNNTTCQSRDPSCTMQAAQTAPERNCSVPVLPCTGTPHKL